MTQFNYKKCSFWAGNHPLFDKGVELSDKLVPGRGESHYLHGEALRCINRLYYDLYNNGMCNLYPGSYLSGLVTKLRTYNKKYIKSDSVAESLNIIRQFNRTDGYMCETGAAQLEPVLESAVEDVIIHCAGIEGLELPQIKTWQTALDMSEDEEDPEECPELPDNKFHDVFYYDHFSEGWSRGTLWFCGVVYEPDDEVDQAELNLEDLVLDLQDEDGNILYTFILDASDTTLV